MYGLIGPCIILYIIVLYNLIQEQKFTAVRINLAGRQRMLSQKITKNLLLIHGNIASVYDTESKKESISSIDTFEKTASALASGGKAPVKMEGEDIRSIPEIDDRISKEKLKHVLTRWKLFKKNILEYSNIQDKNSFRYIINHNEELLQAIDNSVFQMQIYSEKNESIIRILISSGVTAVLIFLIINLIRTVKDLKNASERIKNLEQALPICSNCKRIRIDNDNPEDPVSWQTIEEYLHARKEMLFTHGICPRCVKELYPEYYKK